MPSQDIILHLTAHLAVLVTYRSDLILPKADTIACLDQARNDIPPGAEAAYPIPGRQFYRSNAVVLSLQPNTSPVMMWNEWDVTVKALQWFGEVYEPLPMFFNVMRGIDASAAIGSGALTLAL